jgi:hypothetical protein
MIEGERAYFFAFLVLEDFFVSFLVEEDLESDDLLESEDLPESEDLDESEEPRITIAGSFLLFATTLVFVISLVEPGTFENKTRTYTEEAFGFAFFTFWTRFYRVVVHRLKQFPGVSTGLALVVVSRHRLCKKVNFEANRNNQLICKLQGCGIGKKYPKPKK